MSAINVNSITGRTGTHGPVLTGVTTATNGLNVTGGSVGIGTDNPIAKLSIRGDGGGNGLTFRGTDSTGNTNFWIRDGGSGGLHYYPFSINRDSGDDIPSSTYFYVHGTSPFIIKSDGKVGIGLTDPEKELEVSGSSSPTIRINNSDGSISADQTIGAIEFKANDGSGDGSQVTGSIESISQAAFTGQGSPSHLIFKTNGLSGAAALTERLRITSGGEVQITNSGSSNGSTVQQLSLYTDNSGNGDNFTQRIAYTRANDTSKVFAAIDSVRTGTFNTDLVFSNDDGGVLGEKLRLISTGNVSITNGDLVVASGHGIDFSATSDGSGTMTSELLDDYEEGSWAPVTTNFTYTIDANSCRYTKIGRMVYLSGVISRSQSSAPTSDIFTVTGLPYAQSSVTRSLQGTYWVDNLSSSNDYIGGIAYSNTTSQIIFAQATTPTHTHSTRYLQGNYFDNNRGMRFSLVYIT